MQAKRIGVGVAASAAILTLWLAGPEPSTDPHLGDKTQQRLDKSPDGRYHKCGLVTEDGVTEYIEIYVQRCEKLVPISGFDNPVECGSGFHLVDDVCLMDND